MSEIKKEVFSKVNAICFVMIYLVGIITYFLFSNSILFGIIGVVLTGWSLIMFSTKEHFRIGVKVKTVEEKQLEETKNIEIEKSKEDYGEINPKSF